MTRASRSAVIEFAEKLPAGTAPSTPPEPITGSAMIAAMLTAAGYRTGVFSSPHIDRIEERFCVDGEPCTSDELVALERVRPRAIELAQEIAGSAPIAVRSTRATVRGNLVEQVRLAVARESMEQNQHFLTEDFKEGVAAMAERRPPQFKGR